MDNRAGPFFPVNQPGLHPGTVLLQKEKPPRAQGLRAAILFIYDLRSCIWYSWDQCCTFSWNAYAG